MRVGVMGGTFDPIHFGHLITAETVREAFGLNKVLFVPAAYPPHKLFKKITTINHRLIMTLLATSSNKFFGVSDLELKRNCPSYTLETLNEIQESLGDSVELFFIMGSDSLIELSTWHEAKKLVAKYHFIATTRQGINVDFQKLKLFFGNEIFNHIFCIETPNIEISSTNIRKKIKLGRSIKYLVPDVVENYILERGLYR